MNSSMGLADLIRSYRPVEVASYLRLHSWSSVSTVHDKYSLWTKTTEKGEFEVLLPLGTEFRDLGPRIRELLETLEKAEGRSTVEIAEDFTYSGADIVRAKLAPGSASSGTIPLENGALAFQQIRELVLAAACAAVSPKKVFAKRKPDQAMQFLQDASFGQTKRGSYVLTIISPVPPTFQQALIDDLAPEPYPRRVIRMLSEALVATHEAVQEVASSGKFEAFDLAVSKGVSANLCDALLGLNQSGGEHGLDFAFSWSPARNTPSDLPSHVALTPDSMPILTAVSSYFRQTSVEEDVEVLGVVNRLEHTVTDNQEGSGRVTVMSVIEGNGRNIIMELYGADHQTAIKAYDERLMVSCRGELCKEGRSFVLRNPRGFALLAE